MKTRISTISLKEDSFPSMKTRISTISLKEDIFSQKEDFFSLKEDSLPLNGHAILHTPYRKERQIKTKEKNIVAPLFP